MAEIKRTVLFGKLNSTGYKSLDSATVYCRMRGNPNVELVHWIQQILQMPDSDFKRILNHFEIDGSRLAADVTAALDRLPRGATSVSGLSPHMDEVMETAWLYTTLLFGETRIRTGHLLASIMKGRALRDILAGISREFMKIKAETLTDSYDEICGGSVEDVPEAGVAAPVEDSGTAVMGRQEALAKYSVDLTAVAKKGEMDPIISRDEEIRQIVDVLMRRRQNNPILTGEAGVGKTAVVEGLAQKIVGGDVPPPLRGVTIRTLDVGLLQAGASMKGEFENRLRQVIEEIQASPVPIILFVDEAHTLIGAGGSAGTGDAANLLKPALARGTLRTIAATTWAEYKKYIEKDPALTRRFQVIKIEEPTEEKALLMVRGLASTLEKHHRVLLLDEALEAAVSLSHRYIAGRQLPDKAVSLLDTSCARVAVSQHAVPAAVDDSRKKIDALTTELAIIRREESVGFPHEKRQEEVESLLETEKERLSEYEEAWAGEREIIDQILECRRILRRSGEGMEDMGDEDAGVVEESPAAVESGDETPAAVDQEAAGSEEIPGISKGISGAEEETRLRLRDLHKKLADLQGDRPLILNSVDARAVGAVVADWTGIPVGGMVKDELAFVLKLSDTLEKRVVGQRHAMEAISKRIRTARASFDNPSRPVGVFLLTGPSGVGKTETALALAEAMYGGEQNLITINMSEFQEVHTVSTLKGAPPGYVGYGEGGVLTEAVRRHPYSVVLLDEVEKAHPDVHEIFFQVFDKGTMEDGEGRVIDFKNTIILLTSNVGSEEILHMCREGGTPDSETMAKVLRRPLLRVFPAALLGRLIAIPYYPINDEMLETIIRLQLEKIRKRLAENRNIEFSYDDSVVGVVKERCTEVESGARMVDAILTNTLLPEISTAYLSRIVEGGEVTAVRVGTKNGDFTFDII